MNEPSRVTDNELTQQRTLVLEWLRAALRDPRFLAERPPSELAGYHETIAQRFLDHVEPAGFQCQVIEVTQHGRPAYEVRWTHRGSSFVGFKQPSPRSTLRRCPALRLRRAARKRVVSRPAAGVTKGSFLQFPSRPS